jgi:hypothetical protein
MDVKGQSLDLDIEIYPLTAALFGAPEGWFASEAIFQLGGSSLGNYENWNYITP